MLPSQRAGVCERDSAYSKLAFESSLVDEGRTPNVAGQRLGSRCYLWREVRRQRMARLEAQHPHVYKTLQSLQLASRKDTSSKRTWAGQPPSASRNRLGSHRCRKT